MLFNSFSFVLFLPVVLLVHWLLPFRFRWMWLLAASYFFYGSWNPLFTLLLLGTTLLDWWLALRMERAPDLKTKKRWLFFSVLSNIGCLAGFKYSIFFYNTYLWGSAALHGTAPAYLEDIIIPVGLSFYTFQSLSYTIDVYRDHAKAETNAAKFALFVSFFPQLVAGPVERYTSLRPQFDRETQLNPEVIATGARIMLWGFFKKIVIADRLADLVNPVFAQPELFSGLTLFVAGFFFVVQVYCDFSGYSDIATGCARLFGYELMLNWKRPLLSASLHEFWSRNHISMTTWFRDYLYISLGGNRRGKLRQKTNLFLTFVLSGLWHGAAWTFVIWGTLHGIVYLIESAIGIGKKITGWKRLPGWLYLITFHTLSLIAFRAESSHDLGTFYSRIFSGSWNLQTGWHELSTLKDTFPLLLGLCGIAFLFLKEQHEEFGGMHRLRSYNTILKPAFYIGIFVLLFVAGNFNANEFIYFRF